MRLRRTETTKTAPTTSAPSAMPARVREFSNVQVTVSAGPKITVTPLEVGVISAPPTHDTEGTKVKPLVDVSVNVYAPPAGNPTNPQRASRGSPGRRYVLETWEPRSSVADGIAVR